MNRFLILIFFFASLNFYSQKFSKRSWPEKKWALFHPFAALKVKKIYKNCFQVYREVKTLKILDTIENGSRLDAFRHVFFMAAFSQKIKENKVRKLGHAHEKGNYQHFKKGIKEEGELADSLSTVMDLNNNEVGIKIGKENRQLDLNSLKELVISELGKGSAIYFKRRGKDYLDCKGNIISMEAYLGKWQVPKCLIPTNQE